MARHFAIAVLFVLAAAMFVGCGQQSAYVNPDEPDKLGGTGIDSQDVRTVAQEMSRDMIRVLTPLPDGKKPVIQLLPTRNETAFRVDTDIITYQMRDLLMQFAGDKATFVARERMSDITAERQAQSSGQVSSTGEAPLLGVNYFLTGTLKGLSKSASDMRSDYIYYSFELIDAKTSALLWSKGYDVKKVGERGVLYR